MQDSVANKPADWNDDEDGEWYIVMAYTVMAYISMAYIFMAFIVMALPTGMTTRTARGMAGF